jgi:tRNA(Ile)-lysidine synthase
LQPLFDRSNLDTTFFRNRLRHELLPALEALSPGLRRRVWNMAASLAGDEAVLEALTQAAWERAAIPGGEACLGFDRRQWLSEPLAIRRRLVRKAAARLRPGLRDLDFALAQAAVDFFSTAGGAAQRDFLAGLRLLREGESLWLAGWEADLPAAAGPQLPAGLAQPLALPGQIGLAAGWRLMAAWISDPAEAARLAADNPDPYQAWLDPGPDVEPLLVRGRLPGERFQPLGLDGRSQNLADFMINVKLPNRLRAAWPLVCRSGQILWVPGYRLAHPARLTSESRRALHLRLERDPQAA